MELFFWYTDGTNKPSALADSRARQRVFASLKNTRGTAACIQEKQTEMQYIKHINFSTGNAKKGRSLFFLSVISAAAILAGTVLTGCRRADDLVQEQAEPENYALTVFTAQERKEWEPVIKEFEERTGWNVRVETGSAKEMLSQLEKEEADWDVAFGVSADA